MEDCQSLAEVRRELRGFGAVSMLGREQAHRQHLRARHHLATPDDPAASAVPARLATRSRLDSAAANDDNPSPLCSRG